MLALPVLHRICLPSLWSSSFLLHAPASIPLFLAQVRLSPTLTLSSLMIWYSGQTALFLFLLAKAAPAFLPTAFSGALRPLFSFQQAQYVPVFPLKPAPFCTLFAGLGSTNKSSTSLFFSIFPFTRNSVADLAGTVFSLLFYQATMGPRTLVSTENDAGDELARRGALLAPSAIPCSLSPLISRIHSFLFSDWRRTVSSKFFDTQVPSISTEELVLPRHARCVLSRLRCNGHSVLLGSYL